MAIFSVFPFQFTDIWICCCYCYGLCIFLVGFLYILLWDFFFLADNYHARCALLIVFWKRKYDLLIGLIICMAFSTTLSLSSWTSVLKTSCKWNEVNEIKGEEWNKMNEMRWNKQTWDEVNVVKGKEWSDMKEIKWKEGNYVKWEKGIKREKWNEKNELREWKWGKGKE